MQTSHSAQAIAVLLWLTSCRGPDVVRPALGTTTDTDKPPAAHEQDPPPDPGPGEAFAVVRRERDTDNGCDLDRAVAALGPGCERIAAGEMPGPKPPGAAQTAFDGDGCTVWNSGGFPPRSAAMDFGAPVEIAGFLLLPEMTPNGRAAHAIEVSTDGRTFSRIGSVEAPMQSGVLYEMLLPSPATARFVRVVTSQSPSWVAWRDIVAVRCR